MSDRGDFQNMMAQIDRVTFALAHRHRGLKRSAADVMVFTQDGIELWKGRKEVEKWAFSEIDQIRYAHFRRGGKGMLSMLAGNLFGNREAVFQIRGAEKMVEVALELDAEYRSGEIRKLFRSMYLLGIPLFEYNQAGLELFLLETIGAEDRSEKIAQLINE